MFVGLVWGGFSGVGAEQDRRGTMEIEDGHRLMSGSVFSFAKALEDSRCAFLHNLIAKASYAGK